MQGGLPAGRFGAQQGQCFQHIHCACEGQRARDPGFLPSGRCFSDASPHVPIVGELLHHRLVRRVACRSVVQCREAADDVGGLAIAELGGRAELVQSGPSERGGQCAESARDGQALNLHHANLVLGIDRSLQEGSRHTPRRCGHQPHALAEGLGRLGFCRLRGRKHGERDQGQAARARADEEAGRGNDDRHHRGQGQSGCDQGELRKSRVRSKGTGQRGQRHQGRRAARSGRGASGAKRCRKSLEGPEAVQLAGDQGAWQAACRCPTHIGSCVCHLRHQAGEGERPEQPRKEDRRLLGGCAGRPACRSEEVDGRLV
mmetsp:Transcript_17963/g.51781  ORF Transcript_17963/g.51781 Transcript_17963/m.51781 type:complete len:316 (-) Transcript_17963:366-1313(-)